MVNAQAFAAQPLGIVASPRHPRAMDRLIPVADLACEGFVVREPGSGTRAAMERFFRDARIHPPRTIEMASNEAIKQAVMAGMGMTFMSLHAAGSELQSRQLVALDVVGLPLLRRWHLVDAEPAQPSRASQLLRDFIVSRGGLEIERQFKDIGPNRHDRGPSLAAAA
jgi:DNA-binding transcriptional LysR family regulator